MNLLNPGKAGSIARELAGPVRKFGLSAHGRGSKQSAVSKNGLFAHREGQNRPPVSKFAILAHREGLQSLICSKNGSLRCKMRARQVN